MSQSSNQTINYQVHYDYYGNVLPDVVSVNIRRYLAPRQDTFQIVLADFGGPQGLNVEVARDFRIYRQTQSSTNLVYRGMSTDIQYQLDATQKLTTISGKSFWYLLQSRLMRVDGATPVGFPTNPFIMTLNPLLNQQFAYLFQIILSVAFLQTASTGHVPSIVPLSTDFDTVVVNDQFFLQYETIEQALDRLMMTALPNLQVNTGQLALGEALLNFEPQTPTLTVKLFNPAQGAYGIGQDKRNSINFVEGQNIASMNLDISFESMYNSVVLTGEQFRGSQLVAVPIENTASIAYYGLKQTSQSLGNVVDVDAITRYANNLIPIIQVPIPTFTITPVYTLSMANTLTTVNPGDVVSVTSPSLAKVFGLSNNTLNARVIEIDRTWSVQNGESISLTLTYPVTIAGQPMQLFAGTTLDTQLGLLANQVTNALYQTGDAPAENLTFGGG